jgi:hypothetical protein
MRRPSAFALLVTLTVVLSSVAVAGSVGTHGNHVEADSQHSADGTVVVEAVRPLLDGFVVLHRDDNGTIGEPIGHRRVDIDEGYQSSVPVELNDDAWESFSDTETVWVVFHENTGDPTFSPEEDPVVTTFGSVPGRSITVSKADHEASVVAERSSPQESTGESVTISRAAIGQDGYLVLRTESGTDGEIVGVESLTPGVHEDVTVDVNSTVFDTNRSVVGLHAQLYADDGDGTFSAADQPIRAGDEVVSSLFLVRHVEDSSTPTTRAVRTPTEDDDVVTPTTDQPTTTNTSSTGDSSSGVPGFGLAQAALAGLAVLVGSALAARR